MSTENQTRSGSPSGSPSCSASSDTPETDKKATDIIGFFSCATVPADFARKLERQRNASWIAISDQLPNVGDVIACAAEHSEGGMMFWAGTIIEIWTQGFAVIEEKGEKTRSYILTDDTLWMLLPSLPNKLL